MKKFSGEGYIGKTFDTTLKNKNNSGGGYIIHITTIYFIAPPITSVPTGVGVLFYGVGRGGAGLIGRINRGDVYDFCEKC